MSRETALDRLATRFGVVETYRDFDGVEHRASPETKRALLAGIGIPVENEAEAAEILAERIAEDASRRTPREVIVPVGAPHLIRVRGVLDWRLIPEDGTGYSVNGYGDSEISLPALPGGIHRIEAEYCGGGEEITVIAAPDCAPSVADATGHNRLWGVTAALYGLRSERNLGLGDFTDLGAAAKAFATHRAAFLGINPVHALGAGDETTISPYSPTSRAFYNTAHIALDAVPEFAVSDEVRRNLDDSAGKFSALRSAELIDYHAIRSFHAGLLEQLFETFKCYSENSEPRAEFEAFLMARGEPLRLFALYEAISERFGPDWRIWPAELLTPDAPGIRSFASEQKDRIQFHCWMQWLADAQLGAAQARAKAAGMSLGLYLDLAVGARPGGAEVWAQRDALAAGISLGAPPDAFSPDGQNWALAPFSPEGLRRARYAPFVEILRATMRHAGLIRIDHALSLSRSYWTPDTGEQGGYVNYPLDAMLAVVAIEAQRAGTIVVGEDLGLVPADFRDRIAKAGLYGCAVIQFERDLHGGFYDPRLYRQKSLACFGTHDTPTFNGFCFARDIECWARLHRKQPADAPAVRVERIYALARLLESMDVQGGPDPTRAPLPTPVSSDLMHRALAGAGSALVAVQLDDVLGAYEQQNLPGTIDEHPNWRRRATARVEQLKDDPRVVGLGQMMSEEGRATPLTLKHR